jgi:hypothetical protein
VLPRGAMLGTSEGANNVVNKGDTTAIFGVSKGASDPSPCSLHSFTTPSFAYIESDQLSSQTHFDADLFFFVCYNSTTGHICNDIQKSSQALFNRQIRVSLLRMEQVLVYKKGPFVYDYKMIRVLYMSSFWTTVFTILIHLLTFYPQDVLQRKSSMKMETQMKKLKLSLNTQLTLLHGLLDSFERHF